MDLDHTPDAPLEPRNARSGDIYTVQQPVVSSERPGETPRTIRPPRESGSGSLFEELQEIAESLAARLQRSVAIDDPDIRLLVHTSHQEEAFDSHRVDSIMQKQGGAKVVAWVLAQDIARATAPVRLVANAELGLMPRMCVPIRCQGYLFGYLWLLDPDDSLRPEDLEQAVQAAGSAGDLLFRQQLMGDLRRGRERELLRDLLANDAVIRAHAADQLVADDRLPGEASSAVIVLHVSGSGPGSAISIELALQHASRRLAPLRTVSTTRAGNSAVLLVAGEPPPTRAALRLAADLLHDEITAAFPEGGNVSVGIGPVVSTIAQAHESSRCAEDAVKIGAVVPAFSKVALWDDLGIYRLLVQLPLEQLDANAVPAGLLKLLEADRSGVLVETLEVYLDEAANVPRSIERLNVHRTSLYYRISRIEKITGLDLGDGNDRLSLHLGLKLARLMGRQPGAGDRS